MSSAKVKTDSRMSTQQGLQASSSTSQVQGQSHVKRAQKDMSKAERRELQEKQRAAKAAKDGQQGSKATKAKTPGRQIAAGQNSSPASPSTAGRTSVSATAGPSNMSQGQRGTRDAREDINAESVAHTRGIHIFSHFGLTKPPGKIQGDIHPSIQTLGLLFSGFKITGANARCIATLATFKSVIQDYRTPLDQTLSRDLITHLSRQINYLVSARPLSVTMGNAIRQIKLDISNLDVDLPEQDAKDLLCKKIDNYVRDRIIIADEVIQESAAEKISDGDVILTYARSSIVEQVVLRAHAQGKRFRVIVVDSRPMLEGKSLLSVLTKADIPCSYVLLPSLGIVVEDVTKVFIGAHSIHADGAVYSRAGTALVALLARKNGLPVMVCCETYKYSETVILDSFTKNELGPSGEFFYSYPSAVLRDNLSLTPQMHLNILNPLYDLTPAANITAVVTEVGVIPPNAVGSLSQTQGRHIVH